MGTRARWMATTFAAGSACFLVAPFPGYLSLVGARADGLTFFVGSVLFTTGGLLQALEASPHRRDGGAGTAAWWAAAVQFAGTLFFNVTTFRALQTTLSDPSYNQLVWRPDAFGSTCFLISGLIAYGASPRHGWLPQRSGHGWWQPGVNLAGCVLFGIAAVAGYVVPATGSVINLAAVNVTTAAGAACFLAGALAGLVGAATPRPASPVSGGS